MNKSEIVASMAEKSGLSKKDAEKALESFTETVEEALVAGQKIQLVGFCTLDVTDRAAREGRNPKDGTPMHIAAQKAVRFKVGKSLKDAVNNK